MFLVSLLLAILLGSSCRNAEPKLTAQEIVDKAIEVAGGNLYPESETTFFFRDRKYVSFTNNGQKILKRYTFSDSLKITDIRQEGGFERYFNDSLISLPDSVENRYANSVNSVHYFTRLPFGLNDPAVNKRLLGEVAIKGKEYYKVKVTFEPEGGGEDFEDTYLYWFDKESFKPVYLAYEFHTDDGGIRFREAYNERYVNGIRFVDYNNYKADPEKIELIKVDSLFEKGELELLSKIELEQIEVKRAD